MEPCALIGKCLTDSTAVRILALLLKNELSTDELQSALQIPERKIQTSVDRLRNAGLVLSERKGRRMTHTFDRDKAGPVAALFQGLEEDIEWDMQLTLARKRLPSILKRREKTSEPIRSLESG
jgi:ArsR family transcriptional regulator